MATKYTLVKRDGYHDTAMDKATLEYILTRPDVFGDVVSATPITVKQMKADRIRTEERLQYLMERTARMDFSAKWNGKEVDAEVCWFNNTRGVGMVKIAGDGGSTIDIYACNIEGRKTWYPETACVYYTKGQQVRIRLDVPAFSRCFAIGLTPGTLDVEGWDRIKDKNLAFRINDDGTTTGLFA